MHNLQLPINIATSYNSLSQKVRVMTEHWVGNVMFCPSCGGSLEQFENNSPVADFYCKTCTEEFELKSKNGTLGTKIVDGAYKTMLERLNANNNPNFLFLTYERTNFSVINFLAIPKYFFTENIIEKRKPLAPTARRAGWVGCNIAMAHIPAYGKIFYVKNGITYPKDKIIEQWRKTSFIKTNDNKSKGWLFEISLCIEKLKKREFSLEEIYTFESQLKQKYPKNNNIKAKIRQQLQILRDKDMLEFKGSGSYKLKT